MTVLLQTKNENNGLLMSHGGLDSLQPHFPALDWVLYPTSRNEKGYLSFQFACKDCGKFSAD